MVLSLPQAELLRYVQAQSRNFFPDGYELRGADVETAFRTALERTEVCLDAVAVRGYHDAAGNPLFSHLHADQYATFLYYFARALWVQSENRPLCDKLLQLNRVLFSIFIPYSCKLPDHFLLVHPVGTILLGNASYGDFLVVLQGVTVGNVNGSPPPRLGKGLYLASGAKIIGGEPVGDRVSIGANALVYKRAIPDDSVVTVRGGALSSNHGQSGSAWRSVCFGFPFEWGTRRMK